MLEIIMTLAGAYALITGSIPGWIVGKGYKIKGWPARGIGLLMISSIPLTMFTLAVMVFLDVPNVEDTGFIAEVIIVVVIAIAASILIRRIREPIEPQEPWPPDQTAA